MTEPIAPIPTVLRNRLRRAARWIVPIALVSYLLLCIVVYFAQEWIAFPGTAYQGSPDTRIQYDGDVQTLHLTTEQGTPIAAVFGLAATPAGSSDSLAGHRPTILYFYGNFSAAAWSEAEFDHFRSLGCNVMIPDLSGFGASGGKPSEANFYATADAAWNYLQCRPDLDPKKIIVVGWSMGAGVAVDLASRKPVAGLATLNAFTTLPEMARRVMPYLPTGLLLKYRFDNQSKIASVHCPILIIIDNQRAIGPVGSAGDVRPPHRPRRRACYPAGRARSRPQHDLHGKPGKGLVGNERVCRSGLASGRDFESFKFAMTACHPGSLR